MPSIYRACNLLFFNFVVFNLKVSVSLFLEFYFFLKKSYWNKKPLFFLSYFNMTQGILLLKRSSYFNMTQFLGKKNSRPLGRRGFIGLPCALGVPCGLYAFRVLFGFCLLPCKPQA